MDKKFFSEIDGKPVKVKSFCIECEGEGLSVQMECAGENGRAYFVWFKNVSGLKMSEISYPFEIGGFEIKDLSGRGYQKDMRFFVNDYEEGALSFFCEDFEAEEYENE